ncbi:IclR family transcriptional regulator [Croceibacterium sp. TMG7-5b_MA50]|uniref:IclR family transcriptional regulator n=1 Tax=Croceibacterium sp. TMG7-5b_MA50 TaxID=3121290 RepID=UPI00322148F1
MDTLTRDKPAPTYNAPALEKAFDILELLADAPGGLTISEIAQRLDRSISEVFRIIIVMERRQWLQKDDNDRYGVSYRALDVAFRATPAQMLAQAAAPVMFELASAVGQSCHLVLRADERAMVVQRQENPGAVGFGIRLGAIVDLVTSCSGHVLLAFLPEARQAALLDVLPRPKGLSRAQLQGRLEQVRADGFRTQPSARIEGVTDLSYPVFGFDGQIAAALTIPFLVMIDGSQRTTLDETLALLGGSASRISAALGHVVPR